MWCLVDYGTVTDTGKILLPLSSGSNSLLGTEYSGLTVQRRLLDRCFERSFWLSSSSSIPLVLCIPHWTMQEDRLAANIKLYSKVSNFVPVAEASLPGSIESSAAPLWQLRILQDVKSFAIEVGTLLYPEEGDSTFLQATRRHIPQHCTLHRNLLLWFLCVMRISTLINLSEKCLQRGE